MGIRRSSISSCNFTRHFLNTPVRDTHFRVEHRGAFQGIVTYLFADSNTPRNVCEIDLSVSPLQCTCNCVLRTGIPCMFASVYILKCGKKVEDFVPKKFTVAAGVEILKKSLGNLRGKPLPSVICLATLQQTSTRIIPPHSRAPRGRPKSKRITAVKRRKNNTAKKIIKMDEVALFTNPEEITQNKPNAPSMPDINFTKLRCTRCGGDHNVTKCTKPHDGMGNLMTQEEQDVYLRKGYLIIEIKELGETILPKNEHEYEQMRRNTTFSKVSFEKLRCHNLVQNIERSHNVTTRNSTTRDDTSTGLSSQTIPQIVPPLSVSSRRLQSYQFDENLQSTVLDQSTGQILTTTENALSLTSSLHGINHTETSIPNQQQIKNKFTLQWNELKSLWDRLASAEDIGSTITKLSAQVDTLEADITTLQAHEEDIATSFEQKCQNLEFHGKFPFETFFLTCH